MLTRVRALLAQAESTTYEAEAAAFTAKAQELMARHAIAAAIVWERAGRDEDPVTIRLAIDEPYVDAKSLLLQIVAENSRCRAVWHTDYALSSVIGFSSDVAATETLFTSLLVQSQVAMQVEAAAAPPGSRVRSRGFRSSFLLAYAHRIAERLAEVNKSIESEVDTDSSGSLLPVLAARAGAVDDTVDELFGTLKSSPVRGGTDMVGWARGRSAADRARLSFGDLDSADPDVRSLPYAVCLDCPDMMWQVQEAKQRFSELIERARSEGPQVVTRHGQPVAVVVDVDRYRQLTGEGDDFKSHLVAVPAFDPPPCDRPRPVDL